MGVLGPLVKGLLLSKTASWFRVEGVGTRVHGVQLMFRVLSLGLVFGSRGFRVWGLGFRVSQYKVLFLA